MKIVSQTRIFILFVLLAALLILAACGGSSTPTAEPPTATTEAATATPEATTATPEAAATTTEAMTTTASVSTTTEVSPTSEVTAASEVTTTSEVTATSETTPTTSASLRETAPVTGGMAVSATATYTDAFAYCAAVGTVDAPDARYSGPAVPQEVAQGLQTALKTDMPLDVLSNGTVWRCMDSQVYGCYVGANLPCSSKGNTDKTPTQAEKDFCADAANTNSDFIPAVVTGHDTVYAWRCTNGQPAIDKQVFQVDAQGFISDIWYPIPAP